MKNKVYIIDYNIIFENGDCFKKTMKVKNCMSEIHAKIKLGEYLKKGTPSFKEFIITKCTEDILGIFGDVFGTKSNPFNF